MRFGVGSAPTWLRIDFTTIGAISLCGPFRFAERENVTRVPPFASSKR